MFKQVIIKLCIGLICKITDQGWNLRDLYTHSIQKEIKKTTDSDSGCYQIFDAKQNTFIESTQSIRYYQMFK